MDDDDFLDELFGADATPADPDAPPAEPTYRATVVGRRVTVIGHMPMLMSGPAMGACFREREADGVTVADLTTFGEGREREVAVDFLAHGGGAAAERRLEDWARHAGYRRIWFPKRVVSFDECPPLRQASVKCRGCGHCYAEHRAQFWAAVHTNGQFPSYCLLCGHDLPQWTVRARP